MDGTKAATPAAVTVVDFVAATTTSHAATMVMEEFIVFGTCNICVYYYTNKEEE